MIVYPNAKINLGLNVVKKRDDGFHDLETVFYPVPLADILELVFDPYEPTGLSASYSGIEIPGDVTSNLCYKAYQLINKDITLPAVKMHLHKIIPMGAGLGGGSADAAFFIQALNELCELGLSTDKMLQYAAQLGSDCSFFIQNKPCFATGRGELINEINFSLKGYFFVLVHPGIHVSTKDAFGMLEPKQPTISSKETVLKSPLQNWKNELNNDFEIPVFKKYPAIEKVKNSLYENGAEYASMSGSGSAVYGLFASEVDLKSMFKDYFYYSVFL